MQRSKHKNKNEMKQISKDAQSRPWPGCLNQEFQKIPTAL